MKKERFHGIGERHTLISKSRWVWLTDESPEYTNLFGDIFKPGCRVFIRIEFNFLAGVFNWFQLLMTTIAGVFNWSTDQI